ncbi:hypothetical protein [Phenylobacterium sp.]|uniref:hypothetical protein n=1 Tax=Phenylobacterium sp. TaxID=1871053 RepID=UPI00286AC1A2|nr:hypothetical protein [Phenylobacterium sp.]
MTHRAAVTRRLTGPGADGAPMMDVLADLLAAGGDERIARDPASGLNRYGCGGDPCDDLAAFGASTASVISRPAQEAVVRAWSGLAGLQAPQDGYAEGAQRIRRRLAQLCGLPPGAADDTILAASGTDLHLIAAVLARGDGAAPLIALLPDPAETGRGVPDAVAGRSFAEQSAHGAPGPTRQPLAGVPPGEIVAIALRELDGRPRAIDAVDADFEQACQAALRRAPRVLLCLVDVSKTGLVAPSLACAARLKARFGEALTVLVDACQFRLSPQTLRTYLAQDFLVAITGSKFVGGPAFCGALFAPPMSAARLRRTPLPPALAAYSGRGDWPVGYAGAGALPDAPNLGLLLRWEAALHELTAFSALPATSVAALARAFAGQVTTAIEGLTGLERLVAPELARPHPGDWDAAPTIFAFLPLGADGPLDPVRTAELHRRLRAEPGGGIQLGQPVAVGARQGRPLTALRLSLSARLVVEALATPDGAPRVISRARHALHTTARLAAALA